MLWKGFAPGILAFILIFSNVFGLKARTANSPDSDLISHLAAIEKIAEGIRGEPGVPGDLPFKDFFSHD